jgi:DNA-binding NtrC family response regulator
MVLVLREPGMTRQRILLLETDAALRRVLCDLFEYEDLDVTVCNSLAALHADITRYPRAAVVSDSWALGECGALSPTYRAEILALARIAEVVLTTGQRWGQQVVTDELGGVVVVEKPYDMDHLMRAVRAALERSSRQMLAT